MLMPSLRVSRNQGKSGNEKKRKVGKKEKGKRKKEQETGIKGESRRYRLT